MGSRDISLKKRSYFMLFIFLVAAIAAGLDFGNTNRCIASVKIENNEYCVSDRFFLTAADGENIYIYYDELGIVNVYSRNGPFLYAIHLGHIRNGKGAIAIVDGLLYIQARGNVIYILDGQDVVEVVEYSSHGSEELKAKYRSYEETIQQAQESPGRSGDGSPIE